MLLFTVVTSNKTKEFNSAFSDTVKKHSDLVYRICFLYMKNKTDAEDAYQDTFLKLYTSDIDLNNDTHVKAWLITVAGNVCKNSLKKAKLRTHEELNEEICGMIDDTTQKDVVTAVMALPEIYRQIIYLYYYEGYSTAEIAKLESCKEATVRTRLARGRELLKQALSSYL